MRHQAARCGIVRCDRSVRRHWTRQASCRSQADQARCRPHCVAGRSRRVKAKEGRYRAIGGRWVGWLPVAPKRYLRVPVARQRDITTSGDVSYRQPTSALQNDISTQMTFRRSGRIAIPFKRNSVLRNVVAKKPDLVSSSMRPSSRNRVSPSQWFKVGRKRMCAVPMDNLYTR